MLYWTTIFLAAGLVCTLFAVGGVSGVPSGAAWFLCVFFLGSAAVTVLSRAMQLGGRGDGERDSTQRD